MHVVPLLISLFLIFIINVQSARILCYFAFPSVSHQNVFRAMWKALSERGHEVVVFTPNPLNDKSLTNLIEYDLSSTYEVVKNTPLAKAFSVDNSNLEKQNNIFIVTTTVLEHQFNLPEVKSFFEDKGQKFDLILVHTFFMPMLYGLSHKYKAPIAGVISFGMPLQGHDSVGNPSHPVLHPDLLLNFGNKLSFKERWLSTYHSVSYRINYYLNIIPKLDGIARRYFGEDMPYLLDLERNVSMQFMNVNPVLYQIRPNVPAIVELRMMHLNPVKPLPKDLQEFLDSAREGAVYFSLGSNVKSSLINDKLRNVIVAALGELPYKVLWKWESDHLPGKPANVMTRKWLPQQDVLAHPNIKAFVTQGGLQSIEEALAHGVPLIGIPFLADQPMNVLKLAEAGVAIALDKNTLTKEQLRDAIIEVATNKKYKETAEELRDILKDEPMSSIDKAVWWCEYIIRHKGAKFLRSPALDLPLYQYFLLDVIGATLLVLIAGIYIVYKTVSTLSRFVFGKKQKIKKN